MRHVMIERALPPAARRPGLLQPQEVLDLLASRPGRPLTAGQLASRLERPLPQVLHVVSYMTSFGLLAATRIEGHWHYRLAGA